MPDPRKIRNNAMHETLAKIWPGIVGAHMMRDAALARLDNEDLAFAPGGTSPTLGELFKALSELEHSYTLSLQTYEHDWSYKDERWGLVGSKSLLQSSFQDLDNMLEQVCNQLTADDLERNIDRGKEVIRTAMRQIEIYAEALLIFLGKLVVYFQAMDKTLPPSVQHYIA